MGSSLFSSLRSRLMLLVLLAILPGLVLAIYTAAEQRNRAVSDIEQTNLTYLRLAAMSQAQMVENTRTLLTSLSQNPEVLAKDATRCGALLDRVLKSAPDYRGFSVSDANGNVICGAPASTLPINLSQRESFQRALEKKTFVIGGYQVGSVSGRPNLTFAYPILDQQGRVNLVLGAGIDVDGLNASISNLQLPEGYVVDMLDRDGTYVVRWPNPENFVGQTYSDAPITQQILREGRDHVERTAQMTGTEGAQRLYAFTSVPNSPDNDLFINVGISTDQAFADVNRTLFRNLATLALGALAATAIAWLLGDRLIVRRIQGVINTAKRLSRGDLSARTGLPHDATELGQLATGFDDMAAAIQQHEAERDAALALLRIEEEEQRALADVSAAAIRSLDYMESLKDMAKAACSHFSDMCILGILGEDEIIHQSVCAHKTEARVPVLRELLARYYPSLNLKSDSKLIQQLHDGQPALMSDITPAIFERQSLDETQQTLHDALKMGSAIVLPMMERGRVLGVLTLIREKTSPAFAQADVELAQKIAERIALALDSARLYQELQKANAELEQQVQKRTAQLQFSNSRLLEFQKELRTLSRRQTEAIEEERRRLSREVHDQVGQALTSIKMDLSSAQRRSGNDPAQAMEKVGAASRMVDEAVQIVRRISAELRPGVLDDLGLEAAVDWQLREFEKRFGVRCALEACIDESAITQDMGITAFRILQEALTNVARHAKATEVRVMLEASDKALIMRVKDNGKGIADESLISSSLGVLGMRERALSLKGEVALSGAPNQGVVLTLTLPFQNGTKQGEQS